MSESQQATTQPQEVKEPQHAGDAQVESANDKVVESTEKLESKSTEQQVEPEAKSEQATEQPDVSESAEDKAVLDENAAENDSKALDGEEKKVTQTEEAEEATPVVAPSEEKEAPVVETEKVVEANGKSAPTTEEQHPQVEETNGVGKRKVENGAEAVDEEKSPKKAKVVDEGDQSAPAVEERAA